MKYLKNLFIGRLGRKQYFVGIIILIIYILIIGLYVSSDVAIFILALPYIFFHIAFTFRRCNDLNWSRGSIYFMSVISPFLNILGDIIFFSGKGSKSENKYGEPNSQSIFKALFNPN